MKIAIVGPAHPLRGGLATYNQRLAKELQSQGHDVVIWSYSLQYPSFLFPGTTQYTDEPSPQDITIRTAINSINPLNWLKVGNQMKRERYDLVIVRFWLPFMGPALGTILRQVRKNKQTRILCIADNAIPHEKRPGDKPFTKYFLGAIDRFITMSEKVKQDLHTMTTKPVTFLSHPLYDNFGDPVSKEDACKKMNLSPDDKHILFFGFIRKYKGLDVLLKAMNDERIRQLGIKLVVAGEFYEDRKPYDEIIQQYNLHDNVIMMTDFIPDSQVRYYFSAADLVVQPYKNATQSGITQVAYHFEKPMVVTNVGGLPELVPDGKVGYVAEPDPAAIASAIIKFYDTPMGMFQQALKEEKKKYSWDTFTKALLSAAFQ